MPNVTNTLTAFITTEEDTTGNVPINRGTGNPAFDCTMGDFATYRQLPVGVTTLDLPINPVCQIYIRNLDASNPVTVVWIANGYTGNQVIVLNPGDQILVWCDPTKPTPGITSISLTSGGGTCAVEYFLGG